MTQLIDFVLDRN